jgi:sigma-E factor negative regulatory protein RseC
VREQGIVTKIISGNLVEVAFQRTEACEKCKLCHDLERGMVGVEAVNDIGARRDDVVEIDIPSGEMVKGSIVVFLIPIFFLVVGYLIGSALSGGNDVVGVISGVVFLGLSFLAIRWYDKNVQEKEALHSRLLKVISPR